MPNTRARVPIPRNAEALLKLAQRIKERDEELGNDSPLQMLNLAEKVASLDAAIAAQREAEDLSRQIEIAYERRDRNLQDVNTWVRQCRDILSGLYREEMRRLGEFGFTVDSTPRPSTASNEPTEV